MSYWHGWNARGSNFRPCAICDKISEHRFWDNDEVSDAWQFCQEHWLVYEKAVPYFNRENADLNNRFIKEEKDKKVQAEILLPHP